MQRPAPIYLAERFPPLRLRLLELLSELSPLDWGKPTAAPLWSVGDVAAHLLGGDIGNLSRRRDAFNAPGSLSSEPDYAELVAFINQLNSQWAQAARRISPRLLCDLLAFTGPQMEAYFASLDPDAMGGPVSWAGPDRAPVWFDIAREFTERWHHQQQIRDATGRPLLYEPYFFAPVLDTFVRALPHAYRHTRASSEASIAIEISGAAGGCWSLAHIENKWELFVGVSANSAASLSIPQDTAWRLFTCGIDSHAARRSATIQGDVSLAGPFFETVAVLA
jgi:uncharacterized protein (TIGR03083 family)